MGYLYLARPNYRCIRVCGCPVPASNRLLGRGRRFWARWNRNVPKACNGNASLRTLLLLLHKFAYVVFPTLIYAVPSGGASHIQFPIIGIGYYVHALLAGQRILPACLVVLPNRLKLGVGKANSRCWRPCSLGTVGRWYFFLSPEIGRQNRPQNIADKSRTRTISTGNVPYFTAHLFEFPKNVFNV